MSGRRPEQTIAFRAYFNGTDLLGVATIEMPQVQFLTETISGSGVAGEYESPTLGQTQSMTAKLSWISQTRNFYKLLDSTLLPLLELRASVQTEEETTGIRLPVPLLVTLLAHTKSGQKTRQRNRAGSPASASGAGRRGNAAHRQAALHPPRAGQRHSGPHP